MKAILAVFDNDGTLCDTQEVEGACYARAVESVTGKSLSSLDWGLHAEPTSSAIVRSLLAGDPDAAGKEAAIEREFTRLLGEERAAFPGDFSPVRGAVAFLGRLADEGICPVAIATGCFAASARYKLECCGIDLGAYPHATSSDTPRRSDIIRLAASHAGFDIGSVVYFGDAPWDVRACAALGIPMIGIGRRHGRLRELGIRHAFRDYSDPDAIIGAIRAGG
jgi:beta-phosphoglucomutase-like phosphatase (HAD superfamily)